MPKDAKRELATSTGGEAGGGLRAEVEETGAELALTLSAVLGSLPGRPSGPQALADLLGINVVTASRLKRALDRTNPIEVIDGLPGTVPLRRTVEASRKHGVTKQRINAAMRAIDSFEDLIRTHAGHRSNLDAMLLDWLPQGRREFETRRRQSAYKALSELRGVSCDLDLSATIVHPSEEAGHVDLLSIQGSIGIDRIRPDAIVQFGTRRISDTDPDRRKPTNLDGESANDGFHSVRLDEFCTTPAPIEANRFGEDVQYTLGSTGFGPSSTVDFVIAEVNRAELKVPPLSPIAPYFYQIVTTPSKEMVFDLLLHEECYPNFQPQLLVYDTSARGPAHARRPDRDVDLLKVSETVEDLGKSPASRRFQAFPRYVELLDHALTKLGWTPEEFRCYRVRISYPLHGTQVCMALVEA